LVIGNKSEIKAKAVKWLKSLAAKDRDLKG